MFRSALFKLTAVYAAIIMAICILFSVALYHVAVSELQLGIYNQYTRWFNAYEPFGLHHPATPGAELAVRSHHILLQIIYFNILVCGVACVTCYLLAKRTLRPIEAAHEQQKRFTADVSHELRTPLTAMKMESEVALLDKKAPTGELRRTLGSNLEEISRMENLINTLLQLSSMEAGKLRTRFVRIDIGEVVGSAITQTARLAESKHVAVNAKLDSRSIEGDHASLIQLFVILIENAIKYSPEGSAITVTTQRGRGRVIIDIQDKGMGISGRSLPHVFDRFYRADSARTSVADGAPQGFGLGLSLAKLIADLHSGEIIISSTQGSGTKATVILPLRRNS
jgi:two-component system sensor histidine kinase CiaH